MGTIPPHTTGTSSGWTIKGPPHKWRYCTLKPPEAKVAVYPRAHTPSVDEIMRSLQDELFPSPAFRAWLAIVSRLLPLRYAVEARRFRPGLDYTLATSESKEARLDVILGLVPPPKKEAEKSTDSDGVEEEAQVGGWDVGFFLCSNLHITSHILLPKCYMAPHDEEDDPAVYRSGSTKKKADDTITGEGKIPSASTSKPKKTNGDLEADGGASMREDEDDEAEGTLLATQPGFNKLLLVLRDEGVMRFVKYVSAAAPGSRWDICGEYEVGMEEEEEEGSNDSSEV